MTTQLIDPQAAAKIEAAKGKLKSGSWGGTDSVCMMSAMVSGAKSTKDCVTAGWPKWLAELNVDLFDANVGVGDEDAARYQFALDVAHAVQEPRDYDKARDLFLIARLDTGEYSAIKSLAKLDGDWTRQREAVERVVALLHRRIAGENVAAEMKNAADAAARAAASAVASAVAYAAASAAADTPASAVADAVASAVADAVADAVASAAADAVARAAADAATSAAARNDLIEALKGA
jgi:hypothetical protein